MKRHFFYNRFDIAESRPVVCSRQITAYHKGKLNKKTSVVRMNALKMDFEDAIFKLNANDALFARILLHQSSVAMHIEHKKCLLES